MNYYLSHTEPRADSAFGKNREINQPLKEPTSERCIYFINLCINSCPMESWSPALGGSVRLTYGFALIVWSIVTLQEKYASGNCEPTPC